MVNDANEVKEKPTKFNRSMKLVFTLIGLLYLALFIIGVMDKLDIDNPVSGFLTAKTVSYGFNNGLTIAVFCILTLVFLNKCRSSGALFTQAGASKTRSYSISVFSLWLLNFLVHLFSDYGTSQIFILIIAILFFLLSLIIRPIAEKFDMYANADGGNRRLADTSGGGVFRFIDYLIGSRQKRPFS